eukprot:4197557-Amphidinium_carterae.1
MIRPHHLSLLEKRIAFKLLFPALRTNEFLYLLHSSSELKACQFHLAYDGVEPQHQIMVLEQN